MHTSWPGSGTKEVTFQIRSSGTNSGNSINISAYVNTSTLDSWQTFVIPKSDFSLVSETIDELVVTTIDIGGGQPPNYYLDDLLWIGTGGLEPVEYSVTAENGENAFISRFDLFMADAVTEAAATAYDKIMGVNALTIGVTFTRQSGGEILFSAQLKQLSDFIQSGPAILQTGGDGTNRWIKIGSTFDPPIQLRRDDYLSMTINDDLTGLLRLRASCRVLVEEENGDIES
jgi:hypothetical protein